MVLTAISILVALTAPAKQTYSFDATFVEGCSCKDVCVTEITGRDAGCHGLAAMTFRRGSFGGHDLAGTSVAWAWDSGKWVRIWVDGPKGKVKATTELMKRMLADWGKLESVTPASIRIQKTGKGLTATVDSGKLAAITVLPVFGADGKTAVTHGNLTSPLHRTLMQGETSKANVDEGGHPFTLSKTNGFYNPTDRMKGSI